MPWVWSLCLKLVLCSLVTVSTHTQTPLYFDPVILDIPGSVFPSKAPKGNFYSSKSLYFKSDNFKQVLHILKMAISMWYNNPQTSGWNINLTDVGYYTCFMNFQFSTKPDATFPSPLSSGCVLFSVHTICFNGFRASCVQDAETERRRWLPCSWSPHTGREDRHDDDVTIRCDTAGLPDGYSDFTF